MTTLRVWRRDSTGLCQTALRLVLCGFRARSGRGLGEFRAVDRHVWLNLGELREGSAVGPRGHHAKGYFHSGDVAIIAVVNLYGKSAGGRFGVAHLAK